MPHDLHRCLEEDGQTLELVQRGDTLGVNQLESPAVRHLLVQMQPRCIGWLPESGHRLGVYRYS